MRKWCLVFFALALAIAFGWWRDTRHDAPRQTDDAGARTLAAGTSQVATSRFRTLHAAWGPAPEQLGRAPANESNPEGPMSTAVDREGALWILDQANGRLVRRKAGQAPFVVPLPVRAAQDIAPLPSGDIAVLDRLAEQRVVVLAPSGATLRSLPLRGPKLQEGGAVTGLFTRGEELYAEREHGPLVHLGNVRGPSADRHELLGRPTPNGSLLVTAGLIDKMQGTAYVTVIDAATGAQRFTTRLSFGASVDRIAALLPSDATLYIAASVQEGGTSLLRVACLASQTGDHSGKVDLAESPLPDESFRDFTLSETGSLIYAYRDALGVTFAEHRCE